MGNGFIGLALLEEGIAEVGAGLNVSGTDPQGFAILGNGFLGSPLRKQGGAEVAVGHGVVLCASKRVIPKGDAVAPIGCLIESGKEQCT